MALASKTQPRRKKAKRASLGGTHKFTIPQLEALWIKEGGRPASAPYAASIIMAETGGDNLSIGDGGQSFSFAQFFKPANPDLNFKRLRKDPAYAMRSMISKSNNGRSWSAWSTYNNGAYKQFLPAAQKAAPAVQANPNAHLADIQLPGPVPDIPFPGPNINPLDPTGAIGGVIGGAGSIASSPGAIIDAAEGTVAFFKLLTSVAFWIRVGEVLAGLILLYMGLRDLGAPGADSAGNYTRRAGGTVKDAGVAKAMKGMAGDTAEVAAVAA